MIIKHNIMGYMRTAYGKARRLGHEIRNYLLSFNVYISNRFDQSPTIFYMGVTEHPNLGDNAQYYCIKRWIEKEYGSYKLVEVPAEIVAYRRYGLGALLPSIIKSDDLVVFQSGYTTQDLGGCHELMHRVVIGRCPKANILMMPQTIYFKNESNRNRTSTIYSIAEKMLFLSRDAISHQQASEMFPDMRKELFPDIVTTLIGGYKFQNRRSGVMLCSRNDSEKYYSDIELEKLAIRIKNELSANVDVSDTTLKVRHSKMKRDLEGYIFREIELYSKYSVIITDRYHGTIFSLIASTPVIVIKTNDHKVQTGVDWFKGVYDDYCYFANDLNEAFAICGKIMDNPPDRELPPYFVVNYYDKLKSLMDSVQHGDL